MSRWLNKTAALPLALLATSALALESYVTVDGFASGPIDGSYWNQLDRSRLAGGNSMSMVLREVGGTDSDSGRVSLSWGQSLNVPQPVNKLKAQVRVHGYEVGSCAANPNSSRMRVRLLGTFFNTGNPVPGDMTGDMFAQVYLQRDSDSGDAPGVLRVLGNALVCGDSNCAASQQVGSTQSLGTVNVGKNIVLHLEWDKPGKRFVFARDNFAQSKDISYTQNDSIQPGNGFRAIGLRSELENCASGPQVLGAIDARIDNVSVNSKAKP